MALRHRLCIYAIGACALFVVAWEETPDLIGWVLQTILP